MNIVVITSSPRKKGNSNLLAEEFCRGAAGHNLFRFDAAHKKVAPCLACEKCGCKDPCVQQDDFRELREPLIAADMVVFAAPVYYFGMCAQMKAVMDRFYSVNAHLRGKGKKAALLLTLADSSAGTDAPSVAQYKAMISYLGWEDAGQIIATGVWGKGDAARTDFPAQAHALGKSL